MSHRKMAAFACDVLSTLLMLAFGATYVTRTEFMPYHAMAAGTDWAALSPGHQAVILALMKSLGGMFLAASFASFMVLAFPFREGSRWALWFSPGFGLLISLSVLNSQVFLSLKTPAVPPWSATSAGLVLVILGFLLTADEAFGSRPTKPSP